MKQTKLYQKHVRTGDDNDVLAALANALTEAAVLVALFGAQTADENVPSSPKEHRNVP